MGRPNFSTGTIVNPFDGLQNTVGSVADTYFKQMKLTEDIKSNKAAEDEANRRWQLQNARAEETLGYKRAEQAREANNRNVVQGYAATPSVNTIDRNALEGFSGGVGSYLESLPKRTLPGGGTVPDVGSDIGRRVLGGMEDLMLEGKVKSDVYTDLLGRTGDSKLAARVADKVAEPSRSREDILNTEIADVNRTNKDLAKYKEYIRYDITQKQRLQDKSSKFKPTIIKDKIELIDKIDAIPLSIVNSVPWSDSRTLKGVASDAVNSGRATPTEAYAAALDMIDVNNDGNNLRSSWNTELSSEGAFAESLAKIRSKKTKGGASSAITEYEQSILKKANAMPRSFEEIRASMGSNAATNIFGEAEPRSVKEVPNYTPDRNVLEDKPKYNVNVRDITPDEVTQLNTVSPDVLLNAMVFSESSDNPNAVSGTGAFGLGQSVPSTAKDPGFGVTPLPDNASPQLQLKFANEYLSAMEDKFGNRRDALMAYNMGPGNMEKWIASGRKPTQKSAEARNFLRMVTENLGKGNSIAKFGGRNIEVPLVKTPELTRGDVGLDLSSEPISVFGRRYSGLENKPLENVTPALELLGVGKALSGLYGASKTLPSLIAKSSNDDLVKLATKVYKDISLGIGPVKDNKKLLDLITRTQNSRASGLSKVAAPTPRISVEDGYSSIISRDMMKRGFAESRKQTLKGKVDYEDLARWKNLNSAPLYKP